MKRIAICLFCLALLGLPTMAEESRKSERKDNFGLHGWGLRFGVGDDPDQVVVGAQWDFGDIKPVHFEPNVEFSFGDDHLTLSGNFATHYRFRHIDRFRPYAGGSLGLALDRRERPMMDDDTDLDIGMRAIGGFNWNVKNGKEAFIELAVGLGYPFDAQVMAGWNF